MSVLDATNYTNMCEGGETTEAEVKLIKLSIYLYGGYKKQRPNKTRDFISNHSK
jgi:hypothetical protein